LSDKQAELDDDDFLYGTLWSKKTKRGANGAPYAGKIEIDT
jgi:hypothetical protein